MVERVLGTFSEWYSTPWDQINVDVLMENTKSLSKDVRTLSKAVRLYDVYR
jgi:dynein heavy chain